MSGGCIAPGARSLEGLAWLARVGASPQQPLALVMGWNHSTAYDHVRRLVDAGLVRRVPMTRGDGSLLIVTAAGARVAGYRASWAPRSLGPATWAHAWGCAWTSAWLQLRGQTRWASDPDMRWWSERDILHGDGWRHRFSYQDRRGTAWVTHRPDLAVLIAGRPVPVEVELQRKPRARLLGILRMYDELSAGTQPTYGGVIYVAANKYIADALHDVGADAGLDAPRFSVRALDDVLEQTHAASRELAERRRQVGQAAKR